LPRRRASAGSCEGEEILARLIAQRQPVIMLTPHFLGLDLGGTRLAPASTA
jgi:lauroyl/myristoyl acyltransferase